MSDKSSWEERYNRIKERFPSVEASAWSDILSYDADMFAKMLGDVMKSEGKRSRPGKRPTLSRAAAEAQFARLVGTDYAESTFPHAFAALTSWDSVRAIAERCGLDKSYVNRLQRNMMDPSFEAMEKIAAGHSKDPSYFLEYRVAFILMALEQFLISSPETATAWYSKLKKKQGLSL